MKNAKWQLMSIECDKLERIKPLWQALNQYHAEKSSYFVDHFLSFTFEARAQAWRDKSHLAIWGAMVGEKVLGYCVATVDNKAVDLHLGEIESLYIDPEGRGQGIGDASMMAAMNWLTTFDCRDINVSVAEGNEEAMPFYQRFGFQPRFHVMQIKNKR